MGTSGPTALVAVLGLAVICLSVAVSGSTVWCYVCSYSPKDNKTDEWCTADNFAGENTRPIRCEFGGCEYVKTLDLNGELELFHRNCYRPGNKTSPITDGCELEEKFKNVIRQRCICTTDYCNSATASLPPVLVLLAAAILTLVQGGAIWQQLI